MSTAASPLKEIAAQWRTARRLYLVYSALLERYALGLPPCRELESPVDRAEPEVSEYGIGLRRWMSAYTSISYGNCCKPPAWAMKTICAL
jgi:hypothetical protein